MAKTLGFFVVQLAVLMIIYPLWVGKSYKIGFARWLLMALVASISTLLILTVACYAGLCVGR
jgi:hypothetical protein